MSLEEAVTLLHEGGILAVKGLGGYHLACDAADESAVSRLRARKLREEKPFAVMSRRARILAVVDAEERALLRSCERPIVLVRRRAEPRCRVGRPGRPWLGLMLPIPRSTTFSTATSAGRS